MFDQKTFIYSGITWFTGFVCLLGCFYYYSFFYNRAFVDLEIEVEHKTIFKLYWTDGNKPFSEKRHTSVTVVPGKSSYSFFFTDLDNAKKIRIDPIQYAGAAKLKKLSISQSRYENVVIDLEDFKETNDIAESNVVSDGIAIKSIGIDPYFTVIPVINKSVHNWPLELWRYILICSFIFLIIKICSTLYIEFAFVPVLLTVIFTLIIVMSVVSKRNVHPDEYVHLDASAYYQENWMPPEIEDPKIEHTYSAYGISRLNNGEIYYLLAGKFSKILEVFKIDQLIALRAFNVLLFGFVFLYSIKSVTARLVALPFLLSPQVWYIFSYCVSDALGLFLCFLAGCELIREKSFLNQLLDGDRPTSITAMITVSILLGLLFLLKINYYPFILLIYVVIAWRWLHNRETRKIIFIRILICSLVALMLAGLRMGADYRVNGTDRNDKLLVMQEKTAHHWYKPSTELNKKHVSMYMRDRGVALKDMIVKHKWFVHSFETGFGKYGYFTISGSKTYYRLMKWCVIVFLAYLVTAVAIKGNIEGRLLILLVGGLALALMGASLHRSWSTDFQAQGRYLFPILPMIGVVIAKNYSVINNRLFILITTVIFLLSFYSFVFIALRAIPRI